MIILGDSGLLRPGRWRWLAAIGWMVALFAVMSVLLFPGWLHAAPAYRDAVRRLPEISVILTTAGVRP